MIDASKHSDLISLGCAWASRFLKAQAILMLQPSLKPVINE